MVMLRSGSLPHLLSLSYVVARLHVFLPTKHNLLPFNALAGEHRVLFPAWPLPLPSYDKARGLANGATK